jgi:hypothetical protein
MGGAPTQASRLFGAVVICGWGPLDEGDGWADWSGLATDLAGRAAEVVLRLTGLV